MTEATIFPIKNLHEIKCKYRLYKVKGLRDSADEFEINKESLIKHLSYTTKSPCSIYYKNNEIFVAQADGFEKLTSETIDLVRCQVKLEQTSEIYELNFDCLSDNEISLATRFLGFSLSNPLFSNKDLWQPHPGKTFYFKKPDKEFSEKSIRAVLHRGFSYGIAVLPGNKMAIAIDSTGKYFSKNYLPAKLSEAEFQDIKGSNCVYEFGNQWYEVSLQDLEGLSACEFNLQNGVTIYDYILEKVGGVLRNREIRLEKEGSVISHFTQLSQRRYVMSGLCRLAIDTNDPSVSKYHYETQLSPENRNKEVEKIIDSYFSDLKFNGVTIMLDDKIKFKNRFQIPDIKFGNNTILSTNNNSPNAVICSLNEFPKTKSELLSSVNSGFYVKKDHLETQFFVIPKSVTNTSGTVFLKDLQEKFADLYGKNTGIKYEPQVITYDDDKNKSISAIGNEILKQIESDFFRYHGFALVMIPKLNKTKEDQLASLIHRELRHRGIYPAIIHTKMVKQGYERVRAEDGRFFWRRTRNSFYLRKLRGYLYNVVLNKILLLNSCWPFILENGLEADLTIGIDVKNHTAGFTFFYGDETEPSSYSRVTKESEKLSKEHIKARILELVRKEQHNLSKEIKRIVIHRDGRLYPSEEEGIFDAFADLANEGLVSRDFDCNFIEIRKTSSLPVRFFDTAKENSEGKYVENPVVGSFLILGNDAYIASTGRPYRIRGTVRPIHIVKKSGEMSFEKILKDFFALTNLTWTKIDGCLRSPMTIKLTDIILREDAGEYEEDKLNFVKVETENNE